MDRNEFVKRLFDRISEREKTDSQVRYAGSEVCFEAGSSFEVQVKDGEIIGYNVSDGTGLGFRMLTGSGRVGYASTQILDEAAVDQLLDGALENAALVESEDEQFIYAGDDKYPELKLYNPALEEITAAQKIEMARKLEKLTLEQDPRIAQVEDCAIFSSSDFRAIHNGSGLDVTNRVNLLGGYVAAVARDGEKVNTGFEMFFTMKPEEIDLEKVARRAAKEALDGLDAVQADSGAYRVLLRNDVAATLLATFSGVFSADSAQKGLSRLKGREGETVAAECVTLMDNPHLETSAASTPFDGEGVATQPKAVIEGGRLNTLLHNLKTARKQGVKTTANASRPGYAASVGVAPTNFYFKPTDVGFEEMLEKLGDGLLVTDLQGMHAGANPITGDFSLAAKGFAVHGGKLGEAVAQITVAGNFYELLKDVEAVGGDLEFRSPGASCFGSPCLLVKRLSVAGK